MSDRFVMPIETALDLNGDPVSGGQLFFYENTTTTKKNTYSDPAKTVANANPVVADSAGRLGSIFMETDAPYTVVLAPSGDTDPPTSPIWTEDDVSPVLTSAIASFPILTKSSNYTVLVGDKGSLILVDASAGARTITLPALADVEDGFPIRVKKIDSSTNIVTVDGNLAEPIDGLTTYVLGQQYSGLMVGAASGGWQIISEGRASQSRTVTKTANYTVAAGDRGKTILCTGTFNLSVAAAATLGNGFTFWARNDGSGVVTIDPAGSETIDNGTSLILTAGTAVRVVCDGANLKSSGNLGGAISIAKAPPEISNNTTDATNDIDIAAGKCRDDLDTGNLVLASALGKQIDVAWAEGGTPATALGGFPSGLTLTNDTTYHVFLIGKPDGTVDAGFDTSLTATNLLADATGYTLYRRIGSVLRLTAANGAFTQAGDEFLWDTVQADFAAAATTGTGALIQVSAPVGVRTWVELYVSQTAAAHNVYISSPDKTAEGANAGSPPRANIRNHDGISATAAGDVNRVRTDTSAQIRAASTSGATLNISCAGYTDRRGRDQ